MRFIIRIERDPTAIPDGKNKNLNHLEKITRQRVI